MSLKGYQWLNDEGEVIMYYMFKDEKICLNKDITTKQHRDFVEYLKEHGCKANNTDCRWHTIKFDKVQEG